MGVCGGEVNPIWRASSKFLSKRDRTVGSLRYFERRRSWVARGADAGLGVLEKWDWDWEVVVVLLMERMENLRRKEKGRESGVGGEAGGERGGMETLRMGLNWMGERSGAQGSDFTAAVGGVDQRSFDRPGSREEKLLDEYGRFMSFCVEDESMCFVVEGIGGSGGMGAMICGDPVVDSAAGPFEDCCPAEIPLTILLAVAAGRLTSL